MAIEDFPPPLLFFTILVLIFHEAKYLYNTKQLNSLVKRMTDWLVGEMDLILRGWMAALTVRRRRNVSNSKSPVLVNVPFTSSLN